MKESLKQGLIYEHNACEYLKENGYKILDRNVNYQGKGELDIVAIQGTTLVIVEVKYRSSTDFGHPIESLTRPKVQKILKATELYIAETEYKYKDIRFDIICFDDLNIEHIENAFYGYWN
ncbi:MAG: YraN family protein [Firmicutes bacterium]|nr:YraN family protein [Bacillota bacterium]